MPRWQPTFTLYLLITITYNLQLTLDSDEPSTSLVFETSGKHTFYAISSGKQKHEVSIIVDFRGNAVFNQTGNDLEFSFDYGNGYITVNISSIDNQERKVSFDFFAENDPLVNIIDKRDIKYIEGALNKVHTSLETISRNQQFHIQRDQSHKATLEQSQRHIKWTGIIKIVFLLTSALIQLWIMKGFFKSGETHSYQPVQT